MLYFLNLFHHLSFREPAGPRIHRADSKVLCCPTRSGKKPIQHWKPRPKARSARSSPSRRSVRCPTGNHGQAWKILLCSQSIEQLRFSRRQAKIINVPTSFPQLRREHFLTKKYHTSCNSSEGPVYHPVWGYQGTPVNLESGSFFDVFFWPCPGKICQSLPEMTTERTEMVSLGGLTDVREHQNAPRMSFFWPLRWTRDTKSQLPHCKTDRNENGSVVLLGGVLGIVGALRYPNETCRFFGTWLYNCPPCKVRLGEGKSLIQDYWIILLKTSVFHRSGPHFIFGWFIPWYQTLWRFS